MARVLTFAYLRDGHLARTALELLGAGSKLGDMSAALLGHAAAGAAEELNARGASPVYLVDDPLLESYQTDLYARALRAVVDEADPDIVLFPGDLVGGDLAPRLAGLLGAGLVTDCLEIQAQDGGVRWIRPAFGGKALTAQVVRGRPSLATLKPRVWEPPQPAPSRGEVRRVEVSLEADQAGWRVVERVEAGAGQPRLEEARRIVSGGRGMGDPENFEQLRELAQVLKAGLGASRAATDAGWVPVELQIGQTGKTVAPDLYLAVGISGASQHVAGITGAKHIVAINIDPEAPIFKVAEVGVVADWKEFLPKLIEKLRAL